MPNNFTDRRFLIPAALAVLVLLFGFRCYRTWRVFNDTADEAVHIEAGLEFLQTRHYTREAQHPPLARVILAIPPYTAGLRYSVHWPLWTGSSPAFYWRTLSLARLGNLVWAPFLIAYVYLWGRRLHGPAAGLAAATLVSFSPNLLAHASLATLDFGAATAIFVASYYFWRWSEDPKMANCLLAALAFGVAILIKFSALMILPPIAFAFFLTSHSRLSSLLSLLSSVSFVAVVALLVWAAYLFEVGRLSTPQFQPAQGSFGQNLEHRVAGLVGDHDIPAPRFWRGVLDVIGHNAHGHQTYLLGRLGQYGWWYYFPVALALKSTLPMLAVVGLSLVACGLRGQRLYPLLAAAMLLVVCMASSINLGVRHILAIYPFFAVLASGLFVAKGWLRITVLVLLLWHAGESVAAHPDYLAYFNETVRGREDQFLLDSNLDWGQDLERLRRYLVEHNITSVYLSYFGRADPARIGIPGIQPLTPGLRPKGWVVVSKAHIAGLALPGGHGLTWLKTYPPTARIGKSILVYYFP